MREKNQGFAQMQISEGKPSSTIVCPNPNLLVLTNLPSVSKAQGRCRYKEQILNIYFSDSRKPLVKLTGLTRSLSIAKDMHTLNLNLLADCTEQNYEAFMQFNIFLQTGRTMRLFQCCDQQHTQLGLDPA